MSEIKDVMFRTSLSGYNKADVNEYLISANNSFTEKENLLRTKAERAEKEAEQAKEKAAELERDILDKETQNADLRKNLFETEAEKQTLLDDATALRTKVEESERVIAKQYEEIESLKNKIEELERTKAEAPEVDSEYDELLKKARLYDKTSSNIGETIISANKTAEEIIASAREEARILTERTERELEEKKRAFEETSKHATESIFGKLVSAASEIKRDIVSSSNFTYQTLDRAFADIKSRNESVSVKIKNYEESTWKSIRCDLDSIGAERASAPEKKESGLRRALADTLKRKNNRRPSTKE